MTDKDMASPSGGLSSLRDGADKSSPPKASIPDAGEEIMGLELSKATPAQLGKIVECLSSLIGMYSETVRSAQERYERDCAFLANLMAELTKVTHAIARQGAQALEHGYEAAQAIEAGTAETGTGSVHESAVRKDAPKGGQQ